MAMHGLLTSGTVSKCICWAVGSFLEAEQSLWSARAQSLGAACLSAFGNDSEFRHPNRGL